MTDTASKQYLKVTRIDDGGDVGPNDYLDH